MLLCVIQSINITEISIVLTELSGTVLSALHVDFFHSHQKITYFLNFLTDILSMAILVVLAEKVSCFDE